MSDLQTQFAAAAGDVKLLPTRPDNADLLRLYGLFKQGSAGDVTGKRPGVTSFVERAKYDAWAGLEGMSQQEAQQAYVDLVGTLKAG